MTPRGHGAGDTHRGRRPARHAVRRAPAPDAPRRAAAGLEHPARRAVDRRARAPSSRTSSSELSSKIPFYGLRHLVRPGLTGWAQVKYHYGADEADALEKLQYEFFYLRHQSLGLDLRIVGRTARSVIRSEGR